MAARSAGIASGLLGAALCAVAAGASAQDLDLWPLVVRDARPVAGRQTTRIAGPLFERWSDSAGPEDEAETGWSLRPLVAGLETQRASRWELLHPLAGLRRTAERTRAWLAPFFDHTREHDASERGEGWTAGLAFGGRTKGGERYGGVFPFAGVAKQRFGKERIEFLLFPLWGRSRDHHGFVRTHVLWPFFSFGRGPDRTLLKVWPFYGHDRRQGEWDRRFALWPVLHWRTEQPGQPGERRVRLALPFYGEARSQHTLSRFVLGPLYMHAENQRSGARATDLLWPFFRTAHTPAREGFAGASELKLEPFYRRRQAPGLERRSALFGAYDRLHLETETLVADSLRLGFVTRFESVEHRQGGAARRMQDVWPLFTRRERRWQGADGTPHRSETLFAPWPLPLLGKGFQRNAAGLFSLFEQRVLDDEARRDWVFGLVRQRRAPGYRLDAVSWLGRREGDPERLDWHPFGLTRESRGRGRAR